MKVVERKRVCAQIATPPQFNTKVQAMLIQSNNVYKGDFITIENLNNVAAINGDYADVFETNTRWKYQSNEWIDTGQTILINPNVATKAQVNAIDIRVTDVENAIANPELEITKI